MQLACKHYITFALSGFLLMVSCVEPYEPPVSVIAQDLLVVDGFINAGTSTAEVNLSHAVALSSTEVQNPETGAIVSIEEFDGNSFSLTEEEVGNYRVSGLVLDQNKRYRLNIKTTGGKIYQSEHILILNSPPIDSITWRPEEDVLSIMVNTHDDPSATGYYQWNFVETWRYSSPFISYFIYENNKGIPRGPEEFIYTCYNTFVTKRIIIGTTKDLISNTVRNFTLQEIPKGSAKISDKYSILVQQRKLTEEAYNYWQQLQKTTEQLGGLFDPLPASVTGNITCLTDASEPVLGYFSGGFTVEQRIFISSSEIPEHLRSRPGPGQCLMDSISNEELEIYDGPPIFLLSTYQFGPSPAGFITTEKELCMDCRIFGGGVTTVPDFWE